MYFRNALKKSCHTVEQSFGQQVQRLISAGFPTQLLQAVVESLARKIKQPLRMPESEENKHLRDFLQLVSTALNSGSLILK